MPNGTTLHEHFFSVTKGITTLGTSSAGWMEVMIVPRLKNFSGDVTITVNASDTETFLIITLTVWQAILSHVLAFKYLATVGALETPHVP